MDQRAVRLPDVYHVEASVPTAGERGNAPHSGAEHLVCVSPGSRLQIEEHREEPPTLVEEQQEQLVAGLSEHGIAKRWHDESSTDLYFGHGSVWGKPPSIEPAHMLHEAVRRHRDDLQLTGGRRQQRGPARGEADGTCLRGRRGFRPCPTAKHRVQEPT